MATAVTEIKIITKVNQEQMLDKILYDCSTLELEPLNKEEIEFLESIPSFQKFKNIANSI